jgi:selenocysteine-specific elongation factor
MEEEFTKKDRGMPRDLILGTAGHIDHGKTSLVKALTGIDCDRLPEERSRGITIDIGFASLDLGDYHLGIVDVPGHERFIKNMLAGATGIDLAVLVIAADDSVMPQTREHLEILQLLGLRRGVIALTKCDLVDDTSREVAELEIQELLRGTFLEKAPVIATSAHTGQGITELKDAIAKACAAADERGDHGWFRMAIDRAFVIQGHGTVVTGSVTSGSLRIGDEVEWLPRGQRVRVRSLHNHDKPVDQVHRGHRAAVNLAGVRHEEVERGQEIAAPGYLSPGRVITVRLHALADLRRPIKHRTTIRFHIGTAEAMGTVALLDCDAVEPGGWALAQVFLKEPITASWGQPFIIRGSSATQTLGGGQVLQPRARKIRRRHTEILERIESLWNGDARVRAAQAAWFRGFAGLAPADLVRDAGVAPAEIDACLAELTARGEIVGVLANGNHKLLLQRDVLAGLEERILHLLQRIHDQSPLMSHHDRRQLEAQLDYVGDPDLVQAAVERLLREKRLVGDQRRIARADYRPKLSANQRKLKETMVRAHESARFQPPDPASFASQAGGNSASLTDLLELSVAEGHLVRISDGIYLHRDAETQMRKLVAERLAAGKGLTVADIRDLLSTTRKYAVPLCEYLDRIGVTRRQGDLRFAST